MRVKVGGRTDTQQDIEVAFSVAPGTAYSKGRSLRVFKRPCARPFALAVSLARRFQRVKVIEAAKMGITKVVEPNSGPPVFITTPQTNSLLTMVGSLLVLKTLGV